MNIYMINWSCMSCLNSYRRTRRFHWHWEGRGQPGSGDAGWAWNERWAVSASGPALSLRPRWIRSPSLSGSPFWPKHPSPAAGAAPRKAPPLSSSGQISPPSPGSTAGISMPRTPPCTAASVDRSSGFSPVSNQNPARSAHFSCPTVHSNRLMLSMVK